MASKSYGKSFFTLWKREQDSFDTTISEPSETLKLFVKENFKDKIYATLEGLSKSERVGALEHIVEDAIALIESKDEDYRVDDLRKVIYELKSSLVREQILERGIRADGRTLDEVRPNLNWNNLFT